MSIKIQEVDENLMRVVWDLTLNRTKGEEHETFFIYHRLSSARVFHLGVSCHFELEKESPVPSNPQDPSQPNFNTSTQSKPNNKLQSPQFNISLCLAGAKRWVTDESNSRIPVYPLHSLNGFRAVWASVNGGPKNLLQGLGTSTNPSWSTKNPLTVNLQRSNTPLLQFRKSKKKEFSSFDLKCEFWIEFDVLIVSQRKVLQQITECYENQARCDVQFHFQDGGHVGGHVVILASRSPVFSAMFQHQMSEMKTGQVDIVDIQPEIFKQFLYFIYSGQIGMPLNEENAKSLYEVADKYCIEDLKTKCVDFLTHCVDLNNAIDFAIWADLLSVENLKETAVKKIVEHGQVICEMDAWEELMKNHTDLCLSITRRTMKKKCF